MTSRKVPKKSKLRKSSYVEQVGSLSDRRLKTNIRTIYDALELVKKMRGVRFNWVSRNRPCAGVIAQEIEQVIPELVLTNRSSGIKTVIYDGLTGVLIQAVHDLITWRDEYLESLQNQSQFPP